MSCSGWTGRSSLLPVVGIEVESELVVVVVVKLGAVVVESDSFVESNSFDTAGSAVGMTGSVESSLSFVVRSLSISGSGWTGRASWLPAVEVDVEGEDEVAQPSGLGVAPISSIVLGLPAGAPRSSIALMAASVASGVLPVPPTGVVVTDAAMLSVEAALVVVSSSTVLDCG